MERTRIALVIALGMLLLPAGARAGTFCVSAPGCVGTPETDVRIAVMDAQAAVGPDTVQIGPGTFDMGVGAAYSSTDPVDIVGAGPAATTLLASGATTNDQMMSIAGSTGSSVSQLTFSIAENSAGVHALDTVGPVHDVEIDAPQSADNPDGVVENGPGPIQRVTIRLPIKNAASAGILQHNSSGLIQDVAVTANTGIQASCTTSSDVTVQRVSVAAVSGVVVDGPGCNLALDNALVKNVAGFNQPIGLESVSDPPTLVANHVTLIGPGTGVSRGIWAFDGTLTLRNSVISGYSFAVANGSDGSLVTDYSDYEDTRDLNVTGTITETNHLNTDPGFVNAPAGDYRLAPGSALIDAGDPAGLALGESPTDLLGAPRLTGARTDIGAYEFQQPPPPVVTDTTAPTFSGVSETNKVFAVGKGATPISARKRRVKVGTTFRFTLSEAASVKLVIAQRQPGRRVKKACKKPSHKNRRAKRCTRLVKKGTLTRAGKAGANSVKFTGRIGHRALKPGSYRVSITATDAAGNKSKPKTLSFRVVRPARGS
jgi:hypothetical protein